MFGVVVTNFGLLEPMLLQQTIHTLCSTVHASSQCLQGQQVTYLGP